jgi:hypothetical protein
MILRILFVRMPGCILLVTFKGCAAAVAMPRLLLLLASILAARPRGNDRNVCDYFRSARCNGMCLIRSKVQIAKNHHRNHMFEWGIECSI